MKSLAVDVGLRKGLDLVLLDEQRNVIALAAHLPHAHFREVVLSWQPDVVAIDSPPRWASLEAMRETERELLSRRIGLYKTPSELLRRPFHDWMMSGMTAFNSIADIYPLYMENGFSGHALEVFPHATAVVLAGGLMPSGLRKHQWRRQILISQGVSKETLRTNDQVDAALASLTGLIALEGQACSLGIPAEGVIVLPCLKESLPASFVKLGTEHQPIRKQHATAACPFCSAINPPNSLFCNQCGAKLLPDS